MTNAFWKQTPTLDELNASLSATAIGHMGIEITEIGPDFLRGTMPVDKRTIQPAGILHGGASVLLAETLGSQASYMTLDPTKFQSVGLDINANHVRGMTEGHVVGTARPLHLGRTTHIWEIRIESPEGKLVCVSRITMAILALGPR